jgi:hypothetical protein
MNAEQLRAPTDGLRGYTRALTRRRTGMSGIDCAAVALLHEGRGFQIGIAGDDEPQGAVARLVERRYGWRGYRISRASFPACACDEVTLVASTAAHVFGTLTVRYSAEGALQAEMLYPAEVAEIRARGCRVCEFGRLAVDPEEGTKNVLAGLFHAAFIWAHGVRGCDEIVIEVHPRHVMFYRRMLGFEIAGPERVCERVGAPAVLLRLSCTRAAERIARQAGLHQSSPRSLYPWFLNVTEAEIVLERARRLHPQGASRPQRRGPQRDWESRLAA